MADAPPLCRRCSVPLSPPGPDGLWPCPKCGAVFKLPKARQVVRSGNTPDRVRGPDTTPGPQTPQTHDTAAASAISPPLTSPPDEDVTVDAAFGAAVGGSVQPLPHSWANPFSPAFLEQYQPIGHLGKGAMGTVYLMRQAKLERLVAVKVVREDVLTPEEARRLQKEAQVLAKVTHENILSVYDVGMDRGRPYMVCEYVEGETLSARMRRKPPLTLAQSIRIVCQILEGVRAAHKKGVIHRDLKPGNLLISTGGRVKIGDFGLAKSQSLTSGTMAGKIVGTPPYMSPEQCRGGATTMWSDLYSIGCIMFELAAGRRPFTGPETLDYLSQHTMDPAPKIRTINAQVPEALEGILVKALAKDPARRFETASKFRKELVDLLKSVSASGDQPAPAPQATAALPRKPGALAAGQLFGGRYRTVKLLGEGGMGQVWLSKDEAMDGTEVALKILPPDLWRDNEARETLKQEAKLSQKLAHPNIVRLMTLEPGEPPFLVMEYISGPTLSADLARRKQKGLGPYTPAEALAIVDGIASGLDHAHSKNLIHRDLKPSNVMLEPHADGTWVAKLADFGIAAEVTSYRTRHTGAVPAGTLAYMSPEQLACAKLDARADVYSLGATLYQMLSLSPPYVGGDIAWAIRNEPVPVPPDVSPAVSAVVQSAMAKQRDARPASAGELANRLREAVEKQGARAADAPRDQRDARDTRRDAHDTRREPARDEPTPGGRLAVPRAGLQPWSIEVYALAFASALGLFAVWFHVGYLLEQRYSLARVAAQLALLAPCVVWPAVALWRGSDKARRVLIVAHGALAALAAALFARGHGSLAAADVLLAAAGAWLLAQPASRAYCQAPRPDGFDLRAHHRRTWVLAMFPFVMALSLHALDGHAKALAPELVPAASWHQSGTALDPAVAAPDRSFAVRPPAGWFARPPPGAALGWVYANRSGTPVAALAVTATPAPGARDGADLGRAVERMRTRRRRFFASVDRAGLVTVEGVPWAECGGRFLTSSGGRAVHAYETVRGGVLYEVEFYGLPAFVAANHALLAAVVASVELTPGKGR